VKRAAEGVQVLQSLEDQSAACYVVHASELHRGKSLELVKNRSLSLVALSDRNCCTSRSIAKDCLKRVQNASMRCSPFVNDVEVLCSLDALAHVLSGTIDPRLRAAGVCGFWSC
jgi:hypothetical protein